MWSDAMGQGEKAYPFVCPECGEGFKAKRELTQHIQLEHPQEKSPEQETEV